MPPRFEGSYAELQEALAAAEAERDEARTILAHTDIGSLPNDWTLRQIAGARIDDLLKLRGQVRDTCRRAEAAEARHGRVVEGFMEVCEAVGVRFDAPEAVAYDITAKIDNARFDQRAAEAKLASLPALLAETRKKALADARPIIEGLLTAYIEADEDGLTEHAEPIIAARAFLRSLSNGEAPK